MQSNRYSCPILNKIEFSGQIFEKLFKYQIAWKSVPREPSCFMRTDGQTGMTKLIVAFRNFANKPKKIYITRKGVSHFPKIFYRTSRISFQDATASVATVAPALTILLSPKVEC